MEHDPNRRMLITALAGLTLANVSLASAATALRANYSSPSLLTVARVKETATTSLPVSPQLRVGKNGWSLNATRSEEQLKRSPVG